jgi:hypothetical protein
MTHLLHVTKRNAVRSAAGLLVLDVNAVRSAAGLLLLDVNAVRSAAGLLVLDAINRFVFSCSESLITN